MAACRSNYLDDVLLDPGDHMDLGNLILEPLDLIQVQYLVDLG